MRDASSSTSTRARQPYKRIIHSRRREEWLKARYAGIGASEIAAAIGEHPFLSRLRLWAEKVGRVTPRDLSDNEAVYWGQALERLLVKEFSKRTKRQTRAFGWLVRSEEHLWALATPDAMQWDETKRGWRIPVQIKTTSVYNAKDWVSGPPPYIWWQMQQEMFVLDAPWSSVACLLGGQKFLWADVPRDDHAIERIIDEGKYFWGQVETENMPIDHITEDDTEVVKALWPKALPDSEILLPEDAVEWDDALRAAEADEKAAHTDVERLKNQIRAAMGNKELGVLPDGSGFYTWKNQPKSGYTVEPTESRVLRKSK